MKRPYHLVLVGLLCACDPKTPEAPRQTPMELARAKVQAKDLPGAVAVLEQARASSNEDPAIALGLMDLYSAQNEPARAIDRGRAALAAHPDAKELFVPLANLYVQSAADMPAETARTSLLEPAKKLYLDARAKGVPESDVAVPLGACLARLGDPIAARAEFERGLAQGGDERQARFNLGLLSVQQDDLPRARVDFTEYLKKFPDSKTGQRELALVDLALQKRAAAANGSFDAAVVKHAADVLWDLKDALKGDWRVHEGLGDAWMLQGDFTAALVSYTEALRLGRNPKSVEDRYRIAKQKADEAAAAAANGSATPPADPR